MKMDIVRLCGEGPIEVIDGDIPSFLETDKGYFTNQRHPELSRTFDRFNMEGNPFENAAGIEIDRSQAQSDGLIRNKLENAWAHDRDKASLMRSLTSLYEKDMSSMFI